MSSACNYEDIVDQLRAGGLDVGPGTREPVLEIGTDKPRRVTVGGELRRGKKGWYWLDEIQLRDGRIAIIGVWGVWDGAEKNSQNLKLRDIKLDDEQRKAMQARLTESRKRAAARRKRELERSASRAQRMWERCLPINDPSECSVLHVRKVGAHGARRTPTGTLVLPMQDGAGRIWGLQFVGPLVRKKRVETDKEFWPYGTSQTGKFFMLGKPGPVILIGEGFITCAVAHEESGLCTAVAWNANNLMAVAQEIHKRYPSAHILLCADDDFATRGNPGVTAARDAALAVRGAWVAPQFTDEPVRADLAAAAIDWEAADYKQQVEAVRRGRKKLTDFDDLRDFSAPHTVRLQIEAKILELGWLPQEPQRAALPMGARGRPLAPIHTVQELFERYAIIYGHNKSVFDFQERQLLSIEDMKLACSGNDIWKPWLVSPEKKIVRIDNVGFDPAGDNPKILCNLWGGWPTTPHQGECAELRAMLEYLCSGEENSRELYQWVLKWLAYPIQHPGAKMRTALVIHGPQRVGKNLFFEHYMEIFGEYGQVIDQDALEDKYNDCFSRKLFLIADEVIARQELYHVKNKLKIMVTGKRVRINPKNVKSYFEDNHCNIVFLSNETMPLVLERDDGRHVVIWTPKKASEDFYRRVAEEVASGGVAALHHYLRNLPLGDFNEYSPPPMTTAKKELMDLGMDPTERFFREWLQSEIEFVPLLPIRTPVMFELYKSWSAKSGYPRYATKPRFLAELGKRTDCTRRVAWHWSGSVKKQSMFVFPPGVSAPLEQSDMDWITQCVADVEEGVSQWRAAA